MATYGATLRPSISSRFMSSTSNSDESNRSSDFQRSEFKLVCPLNIPSSPESAGIRIIQNLSHFAIHYTHFIWVILFITLIPERKVSLILLVILTYVASVYLLLLQALPKSNNIIAKILDKRFVLSLIVLVTMILMIVTRAGLHMVFTLAGALPVVLVHAVFWVREEIGGSCAGGGSGEFLPLVYDESTVVDMA